MLDALKYTDDPRLLERDPAGHTEDLAPWSPRYCEQRAAKEGIALTEAHWAVLYALREHYRQHGPVSARQLTNYLQQAFAQGRGRKPLYDLFPGGPITQACRIAGLPMPPGTLDPSFGSVH
jgi:tRNA 2-thiouridine synthesizing protein E